MEEILYITKILLFLSMKKLSKKRIYEMLKIKQTSILLSIIIIVPVILMFQGIDFTDTGWMLTYFQNIFTNPESVSFWFHLYLTHVIGGVWNLFFGSFGLLGFKFAGVLIFWLTALFVYLIHKNTMKTNYILWGVLISIVFNFPGKITIIHYNNLSLLFIVITVFLLKQGLTKSSKYIFLAGITVAISTFVRLPNILSASFIIGVIFFRIKTKADKKVIIKDISLALGGFLIGIGVVLFVMSLLGHLNLYISSIMQLFGSTDSDLSHYGSSSMGPRFIRDILLTTRTSILTLFLLLPTSILFNKIQNKIIKILLIIIYIALSVLSYFLVLSANSSILYYLMIGLISLTAFVIILSKNNTNIIDRTIAIFVVLTIIVLSLGSDTGMKVGSYGVILGLPTLFWFWSEKLFYNKSYTTANKLLLIYFIAASIPLVYGDIYRDSNNRFLLTKGIDNNLSRGIKTTEARAEVISELLNKLLTIKIENNTLLCFESIGMVHYLTKTQPYIGNPWPLMELPSDFKKLLIEKEKEFLPIIIMAKKQTRSKFWPDSGEVSQWTVDIVNRKIMNSFIKRHNYSELWSNDMFVILKTNDTL